MRFAAALSCLWLGSCSGSRVEGVRLAAEKVFDTRDSASDGTPDFLRLEDERDRKAFRSWLVWLAEAQ